MRTWLIDRATEVKILVKNLGEYCWEVSDVGVLIFVLSAWFLRFKMRRNWPETIIISWIAAAILYYPVLMILMFSFELGFTPIVVCVLIAVYIYKSKYSEKAYIKKWKNTEFPRMTSFEFSDLLLNNCDLSKVRYYEDIPYNRVKYFSANTEANIDRDFVSTIFYHAGAADNDSLFQEYGFLVTSEGVVVKKQIILSKEKGNITHGVDEKFLPFINAYKVNISPNSMTVYYADTTSKQVSLKSDVALFLEKVFHLAIQSGWTQNVENVLNSSLSKEEAEIIDRRIDDFENRMNDLDSALEKQNQLSQVDFGNRQSSLNAMSGSLSGLDNELNQNQINDRFGGGQGHGHVGEQYGDLYDKLHFRKTEKFGASHEKNGADRAMDGINIQTKYCATSGKSIDQCFEGNGGPAKYINQDGTMMMIEVPRDQYNDAVRKMSQKIKQGRVPNEKNPANAAKYVKKGSLTYEQAQIATHSIFDRDSVIKVRKNGKIVKNADGSDLERVVTFREKLVWSAGGDFLTGATAAVPVGVVSGVWVYCNNVWQGVDKETALKNSAMATAKPCLIGGLMYMTASQFAGSKMGKTVGNEVAKRILKKSISNKAKTQMVTRGTMGIISVAVTIGPDLTDCLRGRISKNQLAKNSIVAGTGMAVGAAIGGPVGSVVGGSVASMVASKVMDNFMENDDVKMIKIAKEEFIETVMLNALSEEEFDSILDQTFLHKKFRSFLKDMHAADKRREFVHDHFISLVNQAYGKRELPNEEDIIEAALLHYSALEAA